MSQDALVQIEDVSKVYRLYDTPLDRLKEAVHPFKKSYHSEFHAIRNISLSIPRGRTVGIVGRNGSGKSTLLKIVAGVLTPSSGTVVVRGRVAALLELGAGFNPELTGIENVYLNGTIMGFRREQVRERLDDIIAFADIGDFIHQPVKLYSSGMYVRLAFAVATSVEPELLIIDEALSVGDMRFQGRCAKRIQRLLEDHGTTLLFVSHETGTVKSICEHAIYLEAGEVRAEGSSYDICDLYLNDQLGNQPAGSVGGETSSHDSLMEAQQSEAPILPAVAESRLREFSERVEEFRAGDGTVQIIFAELVDEAGNSLTELFYGIPVVLRLYYSLREQQQGEESFPLVAAFVVKDKNGVEILSGSAETKFNFEGSLPGLTSSAASVGYTEFSFTNFLRAGEYSVCALLAPRHGPMSVLQQECYDWIDIALVFKTYDLPERTRWALVNPPLEFRHSTLGGM